MDYKFANGIKNISGAATREILKLTQRPEVISFAGGMPALENMPMNVAELLGKLTAEIATRSGNVPLFQYGRTEGLDALNSALVKYLRTLGIETDADGLQAVSGGQQGLDLMCKAFVDAGDTVLVENPTYLVFLQIARTYGANVVGVDADADGLVLSDLESKLKKYSPKLLYVVPTFSNPTGKTYTAENRKKIVELCEKYGTVIIEDDPYSRLRFEGEPVPPLKTFDASGIAVYVTSFSKTIAPSLRVGCVCGAPEIVRKVTIGKQGADVHNPAICQAVVAEYLERGYFYDVLDRNLPVYKARRDRMLAALEKYMPQEVRWTYPNGGLFIWVTLPEYIDASKMLGEALAQNVAYIGGSEFYADGGGANTLRLNFSNTTDAAIDIGISVLADIIKNKISKHN